jgi:uncharacterized ion transporter superfamily protein YfcC
MNDPIRTRVPHSFLLLLGAVFIAMIMTWFFPAGEFDRQLDPATGTAVVIAGTYHEVEPAPVGLFAALVAVPRGMIDGADVIVVILLVGGAFALLEQTGALRRIVGALIHRAYHPTYVIAGVSVVFSALGAIENMHEEIVALVPAMVLLSRRLGYGSITALAMSVGAAVVGSAFGPTNPFMTGIALQYADLPPSSSAGLRLTMLFAGTAIWIWWTVAQTSRDDIKPDLLDIRTERATLRDALLLALVLLPFMPYVYGVLRLDWDINELSALFLAAGYAVGLVAGLSLGQTTVQFLKGMETMLAAALLVGISRAVSLVLIDGHVLDTIVFGLAQPLETLPRHLSAALMVPIQALLHVLLSSTSGQAVMTMPIFAPIADLLSMPRDAAVLAFQTGAGLTDALNPTNGSLLAMLLVARVPFERWLRFAIPGILLVSVVGFAAIAISI